MGHQITAIVARDTVDREKAKEYDLPVVAHQGFAIIALDPCHSDYWAEKLGIDNQANDKIILNCPTTHYFAKVLGLNRYAIINTDYFGGVGDQWAAVFSGDDIEMKETDGAINLALKKLGVYRTGGLDEFDSISLGRYRSFEDCFTKYWEES